MGEKKSLDDVLEAQLLRRLNTHYFSRYSECVTMLDNGLRFFPREQLFIGYFENIGDGMGRPEFGIQNRFGHCLPAIRQKLMPRYEPAPRSYSGARPTGMGQANQRG